MKHLTRLIISALLLTMTLPVSAQDSKVLKIINEFKDAEGALHHSINPENIMVSTDSLNVSNANMKITIGDGEKIPMGTRSVDVLMFMGDDEDSKTLDKKMQKVLKQYDVLMEISYQFMNATLYSKSIEEGYISEVVMYCPELMNSIILFQGRMKADDIADKLMMDSGKIELK
ncbi:MAG: DUF4252 domain-containing protein [Bacteroidales bacterium]|nr:DUF4252 domain-containing protein [Bacteroidales bacterium]